MSQSLIQHEETEPKSLLHFDLRAISTRLVLKLQDNNAANSMVPSNLVQQLEASIQLRQGANPLISLAKSSHPYKTINRLVIKKLRHPASPRCKTNIRSNTVLDVSPPRAPVSPQTTNSQTLQDPEDVANYRAHVKRTKLGYPWRGMKTIFFFFVAAKTEQKSRQEVLNQSHRLNHRGARGRTEAVVNRGWICHDQLQIHREQP